LGVGIESHSKEGWGNRKSGPGLVVWSETRSWTFRDCVEAAIVGEFGECLTGSVDTSWISLITARIAMLDIG